MLTTKVAIIGGGVSGLYAASLLSADDTILLEARGAPGGRILSVAQPTGTTRFDLGATWLWPELQPDLIRLVQKLGVQAFPQHETGETLIEHSPTRPAMRMQGYIQSPAALRIKGGMAALIAALSNRLTPAQLHLGHRVRRIHVAEPHLHIEAEGPNGQIVIQAAHVLLALPPRLAAASIEFTPSLPEALTRSWHDTATWMAPHAKYLAIYPKPFWRTQGLSGQAQSAAGPMGEIHDASDENGEVALFGFIGVPARIRRQVTEDQLRAHCRAQLVRLFGQEAASPTAELLKDWAQDPFTATDADQEAGLHNVGAPPSIPETGPWRGRVTGIASEWSPQFPGYVAGAIDAATMGVSTMTTRKETQDASR